MLFINTAIALTFLPAILSAPASAGTPSRNDFEDEFSTDFKAPIGRGAAVIDDDEYDDFEARHDNGNLEIPIGERNEDDDEDDYLESFEDQGQRADIEFSPYDLEENEEKNQFGQNFTDDLEDGDYPVDEDELAPTQTDGKSVMKTKPTPTTYVVMVKTGDNWFSGSRARPFLQFADANGNTVNSFLNKNTWHGRGAFKRRSVDFFKISTFAQLDDVCTITLGNDFSGFSPSWYDLLITEF